MKEIKLTKATIGQMVFEGKSKFSTDLRWDTLLPGFGIRVYPSGRKTFFLRYYVGRRERYYSIGAFGPLTVEQARDLARVCQADVIKGSDPAKERKKSRAAKTVAELCEEYLVRHACKKRSGDGDRQKINKYLLPNWGTRTVASIEQADVQALHDKVSADYPIAANRLLALIRKMFNFAIYFEGKDSKGVAYRYLDRNAANPTRWVEMNPENKRRAYLKPDEVEDYFKAVAEEPNVYIRGYFLLMPLLLLRKTNLLHAQWSWVDEEKSTLHVPDSKSGQPIDVHLSPLATAILKSLPREQGNPYIFCGARQGRPLVNVDDAWQRIRKRLKREELWIHDFRRLANWLLESGVADQTVSKVLSHSDPKVTKKHYGFVLGKSERVALDQHSETFGNLAGGSKKIEELLVILPQT